jgi:hypothetical protein
VLGVGTTANAVTHSPGATNAPRYSLLLHPAGTAALLLVALPSCCGAAAAGGGCVHVQQAVSARMVSL